MTDIDPTKAHSARMYDYLLGGKDHFEADRAAISSLLKAVPAARTGARENRAFLGRAVRYLVREAGIRQFLDIGTGLPTTLTCMTRKRSSAIPPYARLWISASPLRS